MIILDLDDTIFETKSMNPNIFNDPISLIKNHYEENNLNFDAETIVEELWTVPVDVVFAKYNTEQSLVAEFYNRVEAVDFQELEIQTFEDYKEIKELKHRKILVTTGLKKLQIAKIKALGLQNDFEEIHIDDPRLKPRQHKIEIFRKILNDQKLNPQEVWVIGDNPDSEIKAGNELRMKTIQRSSPSKHWSELADYRIESFKELQSIIH